MATNKRKATRKKNQSEDAIAAEEGERFRKSSLDKDHRVAGRGNDMNNNFDYMVA